MRSAPKVGQIRTYSVQQLKSGETFIRLPVHTLGVAKGRIVEVEFKDGLIEVRACRGSEEEQC